jgi:hypothetical protein
VSRCQISVRYYEKGRVLRTDTDFNRRGGSEAASDNFGQGLICLQSIGKLGFLVLVLEAQLWYNEVFMA